MSATIVASSLILNQVVNGQIKLNSSHDTVLVVRRCLSVTGYLFIVAGVRTEPRAGGKIFLDTTVDTGGEVELNMEPFLGA